MLEHNDLDRRFDSFLHIAGISESELAWSNIYAYFMDARNDGEYAYAFINALLDLCNLEFSNVFPDRNYSVRTEVPVTNDLDNKINSRIDILIEGANSIIIENKINHKLNNPLDKYWDYAKNPSVIVVLSIQRISNYELRNYCSPWNDKRSEQDKIRCINITHHEYLRKVKEHYRKDFDHPILKELADIVIRKTMLMPESLYITDKSKRINANKIFEQEKIRRELIVKECMTIKAYDEDKPDESLITFKSCPNNNWIHFRYRGQDDLVIGVMCCYLWDWERYEYDRQYRVKKDESPQPTLPVLTLFLQIHGELYRKMKRENDSIVVCNGYDIPNKFCHVVDYDVDLSEASEKFCNRGELATHLTEILQDKDKCRILVEAERIYREFIVQP